MQQCDFLVLGAGIAGLSAAAALGRHGKATVIEAEDAIGYHSSGRSATFSHFGIGNAAVRGLTAYSRRFFEEPPAGLFDVPPGRQATALFVATEPMLGVLDRLEADMACFTDAVEAVGPEQMTALFPPLRTGAGATLRGVVDKSGIRLDADTLLQGYARALRSRSGSIALGRRIAAIERGGGEWLLRSETGEEWRAPVLVNAAGAWADEIACMAGVRPLGIEPKRRTIIMVDPPEGADVRGWPFLKTAVDDFYILPEAGKLIASPVDEIPSEPTDARAEEYDLALAAAKVEEYTHLAVRRISHSWAGLRSFVADRVPTAGFAPDAPGFFWLAGQGGFGLQTAPAMAEIVEALVTGGSWPGGLATLGVAPENIRPERLRMQQKESAPVRHG